MNMRMSQNDPFFKQASQQEPIAMGEKTNSSGSHPQEGACVPGPCGSPIESGRPSLTMQCSSPMMQNSSAHSSFQHHWRMLQQTAPSEALLIQEMLAQGSFFVTLQSRTSTAAG